LRETKPVLICIDLQLGLLDEIVGVEKETIKTQKKCVLKSFAHWRSHNKKIIHVRRRSNDINSKLHASNNGFRLDPLCKTIKDETVLTKSVNSCYIGSNLRDTLDQMNYKTVIVVGLTTNHCVSKTTRMAGNFGYDTYLISYATDTFDKLGQKW
jgi:nicotinamidase-related amidase